MVPRIQKTNTQNVIVLVFQKISQVCQQKILAWDSIGLWDQGSWNQKVNSCGMDIDRINKEEAVVVYY